MNDFNKLWENALLEISLSVSPANFSTWFNDTYILKQEDGVIYLGVPNPFTRDWLYKKFHNTILKVLRQMDERVRGLEYIILKESEKRRVEERKKAQPVPTISIPLQDFYINREDNLNPRYIFDNFVVASSLQFILLISSRF